jgi:dephospho-CoA kinase
MKKHIGLIGLAGSGKDTAALVLMDRGWRRVAFADALKMKAIGMGWDGKKDERGRRLLCDLGMAMRAYDPYHWIDLAKLSQVSKPFVVTDVRFQNEADVIRAQGGIIVRVVRPNIESSGHESESGQLRIHSDQSILNDGSIEHLHAQLLEIVEGNL